MQCPACQTPVESSQKFCPKCGGMLPAEIAEGVDPFVGKVIANKYRIVKLLGEGGMGCVYVGEQQLGTSTRKVAVKTLHKHLSNDEQIKARFTREVGTIAQLEHPNTIQVFDFGTTDDGVLYIVMELVQGKSVQETLEKEGPIDPARVENIMRQVTGSLEEAHKHGIIHRDLKPDNVVLCERAGQKDWVEVLDFGIAKRSNETDPNEAKLTQQGMVLGTPPYMSPEQFTGAELDSRSDIYSLGVMTYEMLTGRLPYDANTPWEWATQHMTAQPMAFESLPNGSLLPARMRAAVMRAMSKKKEDRFATVKEYFEAFSSKETGGIVAAPTSQQGHDAAPTSVQPMQMGSMTGPMGAPNNPAAGAQQPYPTGPQAAISQRGRTEVGAPYQGGAVTPPAGGAMMGAPPYGPPPQQPPMPSGGAYAAGSMPGGVQPNAPNAMQMQQLQQEEKSGGGRGVLIGAIIVVLFLTVGGVAAAMMYGQHRTAVPVIPENTAPIASDLATTTSATPPDPSASASAAPLTPTHPTYVATPHAAVDAGHAATAPTTPPTNTAPTNTTPTTAPTNPFLPPQPHGAPHNPGLPIAAQRECNQAARARDRGFPNPTAERECHAAGGTF